MAVRDGHRGSLSRNVVPWGWTRVLGSVFLGTVVEDYRGTVLDESGRDRPTPGRPGHNVENIRRALRTCDGPDGELDSAFEVFCAYLLLDAWVANQDRHDQNWAVLRPAIGAGRLRLAGSYDHASSLGFNLTDAKRQHHLRQGVSAFAARARAHRFEHDPDRKSAIVSLATLAHTALNSLPPGRRHALLDRLDSVDEQAVERTILAVPELSEVSATFTTTLLAWNRRRLLDVD